MGPGTEHPTQHEAGMREGGRHVCINRTGLHSPALPTLPTRRDAMYGQCDMFHGLDPDSPTRPCGYGDPMLSSVQPGSPAASCAVLAMTDERAEPLSLAETSIKHWGRPGPPAPLALLLLLSCGVQAAADAPNQSTSLLVQWSAHQVVELEVPRLTRYGARGHGATGLLLCTHSTPWLAWSRKPMKESCLPRAGPCLLPDSCAAARLFWERMRRTSSMHSRWQHKIGSTKSFRSVCHIWVVPWNGMI